MKTKEQSNLVLCESSPWSHKSSTWEALRGDFGPIISSKHTEMWKPFGQIVIYSFSKVWEALQRSQRHATVQRTNTSASWNPRQNHHLNYPKFQLLQPPVCFLNGMEAPLLCTLPRCTVQKELLKKLIPPLCDLDSRHCHINNQYCPVSSASTVIMCWRERRCAGSCWKCIAD